MIAVPISGDVDFIQERRGFRHKCCLMATFMAKTDFPLSFCGAANGFFG